ncbi:LTR copia-type gag-polypeptide [Tanacetum coccineum]
MTGDDNNKNEGGSGGIKYDSPYYLHPSDYPKQLHKNRTSHESTAFKAFQRRNGLNKQRSRAKVKEEGNKHFNECNKDGHTRDGCFKLIGYPEWWPEKKEKRTKARLLIKGTKPVANMTHKEDKEGEWIFDLGCTEYIAYLSDILVNKKATHFEALIVIPNGDSIPVKRKGDYILQGGTKCCISFFPDFCVMKALQRKNLIGMGRCEGGLYRMKMVQGRRAMTTIVETWIKRLGHASKGKLAFLAAITNNDEPKCFKQASQDARWREAMLKEVKALEKNGTWTLEYLPKGKRAIDSQWVYKIKFKPNSEVEKYKARLVAKGFNQMEWVDYHDNFAPVSKLLSKVEGCGGLGGVRLVWGDKDVTMQYLELKGGDGANPRNNHFEAANRVLGYLKATQGQGILISQVGDPVLTAYCDSDWLGCPYTRRSRTGYMLLLGETPISWKTKKQSLVSCSSAEAKYKAMASTISEIIWV